jgi:hypothetical protein
MRVIQGLAKYVIMGRDVMDKWIYTFLFKIKRYA